MQFIGQQDAALTQVNAWLRNKKGPQVFRMFGYAGTGKTTLAKEIANNVNGVVLFAALTGKAALVLRKKGCIGATTLHSLLYHAENNPVTGELVFTKNMHSPVRTADLVIIDEVSMIDNDLANDLLRFGTKVLVLGDPAQLPPISGQGFFMNNDPDVVITEIHRLAAENPIIQLSMDIREGRTIKPGTYGSSKVVLGSQTSDEELTSILVNADQVLCGTNKSRNGFNQHIRDAKQLSVDGAVTPVVGDKLICLKNNGTKNTFNGSMWEVESLKSGSTKTHDLQVKSLDEERDSLRIKVLPEFFLGTEKDLNWKKRLPYDEFTYGWAITCHKSQGSQWPNITIYDESSVFREHKFKWLYTAITRASDTATIII